MNFGGGGGGLNKELPDSKHATYTFFPPPDMKYVHQSIYLFLPPPRSPCHRYFFEGFSRRLGVSVTNGVITQSIITFYSGFLTRTKAEQSILLHSGLHNYSEYSDLCHMPPPPPPPPPQKKQKHAHSNQSAVNWGCQTFTFLSGLELEM